MLTPRTRVFEKLARTAQLSSNSSPFISLKLINLTTEFSNRTCVDPIHNLSTYLIKIHVKIFFGCFSWVGPHMMMLFDSGVIKPTSGPKWADVGGAWRKLHIDELQYMNSTPNTVRITESKKMRQAE